MGPDAVIALLSLDSLQCGHTAVRSDGPHGAHSSGPQLLQGPQHVPVQVLRGSPGRSALSPLNRLLLLTISAPTTLITPSPEH